MGAQQTKCDDLLILHRNKQQRMRLVNGLTSQQLLNETVMSQQNFTVGFSPNISVSDFAKIKTEPAEENLPDDATNQVKSFQKKVKCEDIQNISNSVEIYSEGEVNISVPNNEENCQQSNAAPCIETFLNLSSLEVKREFLELHSVESSLKTEKQDVTFQGNTYLTIHDKSSSEESNQTSLATETKDNFHFTETVKNKNSQIYTKTDKLFEIDNFGVEDNNQQPINSSKLVKNPLAFLKRNSNKISVKTDILIEHCFNKTIKTEAIPIDEEVDNTNKNDHENQLKDEAVQSTININELNIKSENLSPSKVYQNIYNNNLDSSLDVNLSNVDTDFDDARSTRTIEKGASTINDNTSSECLKYFSVIEVSSEENDDSPVQKSQVITEKQNSEKQISYKNKRRTYKTKQKKNLGNANQEGRQKYVFKKQTRKPKSKYSKKYSEKDSPYISGCPTRIILKKLPKMGIKTRKKGNQATARKKILPTKEDFPKPFKLEPATLRKEQRIAVKLPKPMTIKNELDINIKNIKSYLKPQYQPLVRLKRLKSEELLVPLKSKYVRKNRKFKSTMNAANYHQMANDNKRDFHIQEAFSLNPCIKFNRLSIDHDQLCFNDHHSTQYAYTMQNNTANEFSAETESKYYTAQEQNLVFHSSTPDGSFSGNIDSGVSTSTPTTSQRSFDDNKTLLLKIAAERAFINNHLMHFGFSPIQFDLYNNLNELNVFLKFLFGSANTY